VASQQGVDALAYYLVQFQQGMCRSRRLFQRNACRLQASLSAGTLFASTKLRLTQRFLAIYLISQAKTGLPALTLKRQIGVIYPTALLMHHKIMTAIAQREAVHPLAGSVQVDDAYIGGERACPAPTGPSVTASTSIATLDLASLVWRHIVDVCRGQATQQR
jgi:hypothetical protein